MILWLYFSSSGSFTRHSPWRLKALVRLPHWGARLGHPVLEGRSWTAPLRNRKLGPLKVQLLSFHLHGSETSLQNSKELPLQPACPSSSAPYNKSSLEVRAQRWRSSWGNSKKARSAAKSHRTFHILSFLIISYHFFQCLGACDSQSGHLARSLERGPKRASRAWQPRLEAARSLKELQERKREGKRKAENL